MLLFWHSLIAVFAWTDVLKDVERLSQVLLTFLQLVLLPTASMRVWEFLRLLWTFHRSDLAFHGCGGLQQRALISHKTSCKHYTAGNPCALLSLQPSETQSLACEASPRDVKTRINRAKPKRSEKYVDFTSGGAHWEDPLCQPTNRKWQTFGHRNCWMFYC